MNINRATVRVSDPAELLSLVPYALGFEPRQSLVILSFRDIRLLSVARIDLPEAIEAAHNADYRASLADLAAILARHGATTVILAGYGTHDLVGTAVQIATDVFRDVDMPVRDALRVQADRYYSLICDNPTCCPVDGKPFDPTTSVVAATATFAGMVAVRDRDELLSQLTPVSGTAREAFAEATARACAQLVDRLDAAAPGADDHDTSPASPLGHQLLHEGQDALTDAVVCYRSGQILDDDHAAYLTVLLNLPSVRAAAAGQLTGEPWEIAMWSDLVRRAEPDFVASSANLLAICALRAGSGLLASLAVARAIHTEPDNRLAHLLRRAIETGMSPGEVAALLTP